MFGVELLLKAVAYRLAMVRSGWRVFALLVVGLALEPAAGPLSVLHSLRVLRVFPLVLTSRPLGLHPVPDHDPGKLVVGDRPAGDGGLLMGVGVRGVVVYQARQS